MSETAATASTPKPRRRKASWGKWVFLLLLIGGGVAGWRWYSTGSKNDAPEFRTATVIRGDVIQEVTANGSLSPVKNVEVGSQVSGIIEKIYVDFNSRVKEGDMLVKIDPSTFEQNLRQSEAELDNSQASLELAQVNYRRAKELFKNNLISAAEHDTTLATLHQAEASVKIRQANVERAKVDVSRTKITAPIDGVVISRNVDEGQTVAASFNTPKLFVIANDLTKMQIEAAVSEADLGGVEEGQKVNFQVDAFPNRKFLGSVRQLRFAAVTNQNVVTYTAVVEVSNPDLKLRPGMTATARIVTGQKPGVLKIANAALRFRPPPNVTVLMQTNAVAAGSTNRAAVAAVATDESGVPIPPWRAERRRPTPEEREKFEASLTPEQKEKYQQAMEQMRRRIAEGGGGGGSGPGGSGGRGFGDAAGTKPEGPTTATVYLLEKSVGADGKEEQVAKAVTIKAGITDGSSTEVIEGLKEGDAVITGISTVTLAGPAQPQSNPFAPTFGRPPASGQRGGQQPQRR